MSAVCPACGIAVVSGYVRCPKCHAELPPSASYTTKRSAVVPGGTALPPRRSPIPVVIVAVGLAAAIILVFGLRGGRKPTEAALLPPESIEPGASSPTSRVAPPAVAPAPAPVAAETAAPGPAAATDLEDTLRRLRLWGRVEISGPRVDVRSGSCGDPAMQPAIEAKRPLLHGAGLTKLRCLEQSGAVVFERDL